MDHPVPYVHKGLHILRMPKTLVEGYDDIQEECQQLTLQYPCILHIQCYQLFLRYQMVSLSCIHFHIKSKVEFSEILYHNLRARSFIAIGLDGDHSIQTKW